MDVLPDVVLRDLFRYLNFGSNCRLRRVSRRWQEVLVSVSAFGTLCLEVHWRSLQHGSSGPEDTIASQVAHPSQNDGPNPVSTQAAFVQWHSTQLTRQRSILFYGGPDDRGQYPTHKHAAPILAKVFTFCGGVFPLEWCMWAKLSLTLEGLVQLKSLKLLSATCRIMVHNVHMPDICWESLTPRIQLCWDHWCIYHTLRITGTEQLTIVGDPAEGAKESFIHHTWDVLENLDKDSHRHLHHRPIAAQLWHLAHKYATPMTDVAKERLLDKLEVRVNDCRGKLRNGIGWAQYYEEFIEPTIYFVAITQEPGAVLECLREISPSRLLPVDMDAVRKWAVRPFTLRLLDSCLWNAEKIARNIESLPNPFIPAYLLQGFDEEDDEDYL